MGKYFLPNVKKEWGGAGRILMIFSAVPHETEEMVKISHMARVRAHAHNFCITMLAKLATFLDQSAMLEEHLSQKKHGSPK